MRIDIYQSQINLHKFLTVEAGTLVAGMTLQDPEYAKLKPYKMGSTANFRDQSVAFDADAAILAIQRDGYYLHQFSVTNS